MSKGKTGRRSFRNKSHTGQLGAPGHPSRCGSVDAGARLRPPQHRHRGSGSSGTCTEAAMWVMGVRPEPPVSPHHNQAHTLKDACRTSRKLRSRSTSVFPWAWAAWRLPWCLPSGVSALSGTCDLRGASRGDPVSCPAQHVA